MKHARLTDLRSCALRPSLKAPVILSLTVGRSPLAGPAMLVEGSPAIILRSALTARAGGREKYAHMHNITRLIALFMTATYT